MSDAILNVKNGQKSTLNKLFPPYLFFKFAAITLTIIITPRISMCQSNFKNINEYNEKRDSIVVDHV